MPGHQCLRRSRIAVVDSAAKQLHNVTSEVRSRPWIAPQSSSPSTRTPTSHPRRHASPRLRQYTGDVEAARVLYFLRVLRTVVAVASSEI
ncbi:hypothetical protein [Streptomyces sp. NPDC015414]|uniref:hypothetical protein n=1 Tax=Streptomyces sp. NPDC015414 TaxID=3364957 RepID=UPI0037018098